MLRQIDRRIAELEKIKQSIQAVLAEFGVKSDSVGKAADVPFVRKLQAASLKELRVAAIMDRFTLECFQPECILTQLTPENWRAEMEEADPELLFIESAWEGKDGLWHGKVNHCTPELYALTDYCHENRIPVVFWNKEDPIYTDTFMPAAGCADVVFTTDLERVERYKTELGHDRVYHLHFAAQPKLHNPIEKLERKDRFCFAGAYYHRYQERCKVFDAFAEHFIQTRGLDIYDRNYPSPRPEHKFPEKYDPYILGRLDPSEIETAYKGYLFGINMNSVIQSQTMFARRVFELMASNTIVVGNYSRGVKNYFGDLTICTDDAKTLKDALERYCGTTDEADKLRLLALRKVLLAHLCEDRLVYVVQKVFGKNLKRPLPSICVYARVQNREEAARVTKMFRRQTYHHKQLVLVGEGLGSEKPDGVIFITPEQFADRKLDEICRADFAAYFASTDWYGENYLLDLALSQRYGTFDAVGKGEYLSVSDDGVQRQGQGWAYRPTEALAARRAMVSREICVGLTGSELTKDTVWQTGNMLAVDALNYCENWAEEICPVAQDLVLPDQGIPLDQIEAAAEHIVPMLPALDSSKIEAAEIAAAPIGPNVPVKLEFSGRNAVMTSQLPADAHHYIYLKEEIELLPLLEDGTLSVLFQGRGDLNLICACVFYDGQKNKLDVKYPKLGRREKVAVPPEANFVKLAYRPKGPGQAVLDGVELGTGTAASVKGGCFLTRSNVLILTNHYPAPDDLYRNMFVHKRVSAYKERGQVVDVMRMNPYVKEQFREFESVNITEGHENLLAAVLSNGTIDTVCVHFLDRDMWEVLKHNLDSARLIIWSHGADIQPWWRRTFNYKTEEELTLAKKESEKRMALWNEVFDAAECNPGRIQFVFVSNYSRGIVEEDYKCSLEKFSLIIPNLIDTSLFRYAPKSAEDRLHIISIRPFTSQIYGNDMTVKAITLLSKQLWFDELNFTIIGKGPDFNETVKALKKFRNVTLREEFLRQDEIAELYSQNGIVLIPTRGDTQGVSRDEAMSCGLVPVTNAVAAIPEFADETCGILAPNEDYEALANGIERLYQDPELFLEMSKNAAERVRRQSSAEHTIGKELLLIFPR